ncbi:hypothetical protein KAU88_10125 [Candidatus Bathyarchaeota archaeon]|nr:hypothetical protein [Candidatus Bathyarchaeota archaeon]
MALGGRPKEEGGHFPVKHSLNVEVLKKLKMLSGEQHKYRSKVVEEAIEREYDEMQHKKMTGMDRREATKRVGQNILQGIHNINVGDILVNLEHLTSKEDLSSLTTQEIIDKVKAFTESHHRDEFYDIFLHFLANYPASMCKRKVSPTLKYLIGFYYRLSRMLKKEYGDVSPISMEELSEIFGRSKATIHECTRATEGAWNDFLELKKREEEIEAEAKRELIEETKERLRKEKAGLREKIHTE